MSHWFENAKVFRCFSKLLEANSLPPLFHFFSILAGFKFGFANVRLKTLKTVLENLLVVDFLGDQFLVFVILADDDSLAEGAHCFFLESYFVVFHGFFAIFRLLSILCQC